ncbi:MAG: LysM peptidoglycan-binding domain-containing protein [Syntrophomonadaceae bacterium]|nr:LysM peptidoglycan-binding domain-containing protein [Syntrophomonadaceae bacterium]
MFNNRIRRSIAPLLVGAFLLAGLLMPTAAAYADYGDRLLGHGTRGEDVRQLQQDLSGLGFSTYGVDGIFGALTQNAVLSFQKANNLQVDGIAGPITKSKLTELMSQKKTMYLVQKGDSLWLLANRFGTTVNALKQANSLTSDTIYAGQQLLIPNGGGSTTTTPATPSRGDSRYGQLVDWSKVNSMFKVGSVATVTDLDTGTTWQVKRMGGSKHADCEPLTAQDAAKMKSVWGGSWSWARRAIVINIDGQSIAASQHAMPHGSATISNNNFPGHFCIHFLNSMTHGGNQWAPSPAHVDSAHQAAVQKAAGR